MHVDLECRELLDQTLRLVKGKELGDWTGSASTEQGGLRTHDRDKGREVLQGCQHDASKEGDVRGS